MKLRKMLGKMDSPECQALMRQMETQSKQTLAAWAVAYAKERYLPLYQSAYPAEERLPAALEACAAYLRGGAIAHQRLWIFALWRGGVRLSQRRRPL